MYYQLSYDKCLNADSFFLEEGKEWVNGVSMILRFLPIFSSIKLENEDYEQTIQLRDTRSNLSNLVKISYDNESKSFSFSEHPEIKGKYEIIGYTKDIIRDRESILSKPTSISRQEFDFIIEKYGHYFHSDSNLQNLSYSWEEVTNIKDGVIVENTREKHSNSLIDTLEKSLTKEKNRHEKALSNRGSSISMKERYRNQCLQFMREIEFLENQKEFYLYYEKYEQDCILNSYVQLIHEWNSFTNFIEKKGIYNYG